MMTARRGVTVGAAVIGAAWLAALGCALIEPVPIEPRSECYAYGGAGYWYESEPNTFTLCTDGSVPVTIQFKDEAGQPVDGGGTGDAPGCATYVVPPDAKYTDWVQAPRDDGGEELLVVLPMPGSAGTAVAAGALPAGAQEYVFGCAALKAKATDVARTYEVAAMATSLAEAQALVSPLIYHGVGGNVPFDVSVHFDIEVELVGLAVEIRSSLHGHFDDFRVDVEGQTVADLGSGLNVQVSHPGSRWTTVVATIPLTQLSDDTDLTLVQQAHGDPDPLVLSLDF
jgi:hypothetical protein